MNAVVVEELSKAARRMTNADIFGSLPRVDISTESILKALDEGRAGR